MSASEIIEAFTPLFAPQTVAVIGASARGTALPNTFIRRIREFGYKGDIYPIHPTAPEIDGLPAYRSRCWRARTGTCGSRRSFPAASAKWRRDATCRTRCCKPRVPAVRV